ncbi:restriction endonuclease subunit R [Oleiphilus sp. HI0133]|nr:restriction endonuclease subunit R [Oleiphilus sp. HI0133]
MIEQGLYEQLITNILKEKLDGCSQQIYSGRSSLTSEEASLYLSRHIARVLELALDSFPKDSHRVQNQVKLVNQLINWLQTNVSGEELTEALLDEKGELLNAVFLKNDPIAADLAKYAKEITPHTGLSQSELFTGANAGISLESELKREIASADEIWWLVSFVKWSGVRVFEQQLRDATKRGAKVRLVTTSYMGATDQKAVDFFSSLTNTEVRLNYNTDRERLHAKAYLFLRNTGFDTGYIGSSNLSRSALTNGLEWNLKTTTQEIPHIISKFKKTFESYWASEEFVSYDGRNEFDQQKLRRELSRSRGGDTSIFGGVMFDLSPHPYQAEMLEQLRVERDLHNRHRNLVVAATGTGKTIISAFDFRSFQEQHPNARLLFVAHRLEILKQARDTYRAVLKDHSFGELWVGQFTPSHYRQLFVSVQTLNNNLASLQLSEDYYDFIVVDEVHHIAASSYRSILNSFRPKILLGLTATPERHDGTDILEDFCGTIAAELRLPEAINNRHLCPFQYFGIDDPVDISKVSWKQGRYDINELTKVYTQHDSRTKHIVQNIRHIVDDVSEMKALAFCASVEHARYMASKLNQYELPAAHLTSENNQHRDELQSALRQGDIKVLCVVDIFNEGVDIPEVNTVLFLRPTESLTIFLQQLGRGLRLAKNKDCLTVLDFVGNAHVEYDFTQKLRALVGRGRRSIEEELHDDFPHLPLGCSIVLQEQAQSTILRNIRNAVPNRSKLIRSIQNFSHQSSLPLTLENFLRLNPSITLADIYKPKINQGGGWTRLCIEAGKLEQLSDSDERIESAFYKALKNRLSVCDCYQYLSFVASFLKTGTWDTGSTIEQQMALMLYYDFWQADSTKSGFNSLDDALQALRSNKSLVDECLAAIAIKQRAIKFESFSLQWPGAPVLRVHARYSRDQILSALDVYDFDKAASSREGVLELKDKNTELLFVTLEKDSSHYSPTTLYDDYAVSEELFHWQTQNSARPDKGKGKSYIEQRENQKTIVLFVREQTKDEFGRTMGFVCLGTARFVSASGSQPMNITWKLDIPLPAFLWQAAAKLAVG